jgi:hypothetical protein
MRKAIVMSTGRRTPESLLWPSRGWYSEVLSMQRLSVRIVCTLCVVLSATLAAVEISAVAREVRTTDRNGDGRPDVWRYFDARGQITEVDVDSNFDGKPDIEEYYERGVLVRRESDRNFNGQTDLIEEFDATTHWQTRSVIDVDFDGTADLLVLFRDGRPIFTKHTGQTRSDATSRSAARPGDFSHLIPLIDPFKSEAAVRTGGARSDGEPCIIGLSTCGGLPAPRFTIVDLRSPSAHARTADAGLHAPAVRLSRSPRAPPVV